MSITTVASSSAPKTSAARESSGRGTRKGKAGKRTRQSARSAPSPAPLERIFEDEVRDISDAENQVAAFIPKVASAVQLDDLQACLEDLGELTRRRVQNLGRLAEAHGIAKGRKTCVGMRGLIAEAKKTMRGRTSLERDIQLITQLQKLLHYEIASSGSLRSWSERIGDEDAVILFDNMTREKKDIDRDLTEIAESGWWQQMRGADRGTRARGG
jgi:ferritin-like metal-binding protein YciE